MLVTKTMYLILIISFITSISLLGNESNNDYLSYNLSSNCDSLPNLLLVLKRDSLKEKLFSLENNEKYLEIIKQLSDTSMAFHRINDSLKSTKIFKDVIKYKKEIKTLRYKTPKWQTLAKEKSSLGKLIKKEKDKGKLQKLKYNYELAKTDLKKFEEEVGLNVLYDIYGPIRRKYLSLNKTTGRNELGTSMKKLKKAKESLEKQLEIKSIKKQIIILNRQLSK